MSMEKAVKHGKVKRRKYYDSRTFDYSCRHGGNCAWCSNGRQFKGRKDMAASQEQVEEFWLQYERFWEDSLASVELAEVLLSHEELLKIANDPRFEPDWEAWNKEEPIWKEDDLTETTGMTEDERGWIG